MFQLSRLYIHCFIIYIICHLIFYFIPKIVSEYDQEIPQSQTADKPMAPRGSKPSKAFSSLFPIKMIAKLEWT